LKKKVYLTIPNNKNIQLWLIQKYYSIPISDHVGIEKTYDGIAQNFYWPKLSKDIKKFVTVCNECQQNKSSNQSPTSLLQPLATPTN
jgi:hypothetical protein